jgi:peptide/nickel transport system substrate-binding protein
MDARRQRHHRQPRNPYNWKVDPEGNQLSYIEEIQLDLVENGEVVNLMTANGEIDMQFRHITIPKFPVLQENSEAGEYRLLRWPDAQGSAPTFYPNLTTEDPLLRPCSTTDGSTKRFRSGSIASRSTG